MSNVYYQVLGIITKETKKKITFLAFVMAVVFLMLYVGFFISRVLLASGLKSCFNLTIFIFCLLGMSVWIFVVRNDTYKIKGKNFSSITKKIATEISLIGIDSPEKLDMLIQEINKMNDLEKENKKILLRQLV
ncbi:hypothetical protein [Melissococcus plutonius]|uniref:Uncharacterized protein n=1 Tax=Melissococcus plutonius (strain ATCC 35311 / DSM 29964 / CIP 104052 / LMG 20360 / NCIMB 702443) TaxID=940190 RepID=F3Y943_MELPT|nr:hypothetical protein [Melissococcus plutonius]AIM25632.1 hypothetical protein MEPL_c004780 [Melissococcus plutonius S1]KMT24698.1 hypothetical protein MEPL2_2c02250 [Melissococcus plutonius]KMT27412.1 hypothetical protein MEPL3_1c05070 [Melissococcus plutonius]KMT27585.1 hypothetical protein MEPL1_3c02180 [Melissococcus plutonius]KMT29358.1 hypothetical protein MEPL4_3c02170 [Melissococcus plutonius]